VEAGVSVPSPRHPEEAKGRLEGWGEGNTVIARRRSWRSNPVLLDCFTSPAM